MKLELGIMAGAESKQWLMDITKIVDRLEALLVKTETRVQTGVAEDDEETAPQPVKATKGKKAVPAPSFDDEDEEEETAKPAAKATSSFDDEDEEEETAAPVKATKGKKAAASFDDEVEEDEAPVAPSKKTKEKKLTFDDVNDACKARVLREIQTRGCTGKDARSAVLKLLTKKFKVTSVSELEPTQYADLIKVMQA